MVHLWIGINLSEPGSEGIPRQTMHKLKNSFVYIGKGGEFCLEALTDCSLSWSVPMDTTRGVGDLPATGASYIGQDNALPSHSPFAHIPICHLHHANHIYFRGASLLSLSSILNQDDPRSCVVTTTGRHAGIRFSTAMPSLSH